MVKEKKKEIKKKDDVNLEKENEMLRKEVEELKSLVKELLQRDKKEDKKEEVEKRKVDDESPFEISPHRLIKITSLFTGGMTLRGAKNQPIRFDKFGVQRPVTYEDLIHICNEYRNLAEEGYFYIDDKEAVKALYLEDHYKHIVDRDTIRNLIKLDEEKIKEIYNNLSQTLQESFLDIVIDGIERGDYEFNDRNKINLISQLCGKNLYEIVERRREAKQ